MEINLEEVQKGVLADFDFERILVLMESLDWKWALHGGLRVPNIDELRIHALSIVRDAVKCFQETKKAANVSGGGFSATVFENGFVGLDFVVESCMVRGGN